MGAIAAVKRLWHPGSIEPSKQILSGIKTSDPKELLEAC